MVKTLEVNFSYTQPQLDIFFPVIPKKFTIVTKGRRFGATHGAAIAYIEKLLCGEGPFLWGDTIHANIDRYFERYFLPTLKKNKIKFHFNKKNKQLTINGQYMDFRSADKPENWEGFGYKEIFLNEAGIILNNDYLYTNAILPMLLDYPDSRLIAAGVPKGKLNKMGAEHKFYFLYKRAKTDTSKYRLLQYTSYDNPLLRAEDIAELEKEMELMDPEQVRQVRDDAVIATGRSDYPNQVNNVLGFPCIFRGALDVRAKAINEAMKGAAARALAELAKRGKVVPQIVRDAYGNENFELGPSYIIPKPFDPRILTYVVPAVAQAAMDSGVARRKVDIVEYGSELSKTSVILSNM